MKILLYFSALMTFYTGTVSGHGFRFYRRTTPPPREDVCFISRFNHVHAGQTFVDQMTCEERICVQKAGFSRFEFLKQRCKFKGDCIEPGMKITDEESCIMTTCTVSGSLRSGELDNDCTSKKEDKKKIIVKKEESTSKCSGCEFKNACIETNKWHMFPSNGNCRRVKCKRNGKLSKDRPAKRWQLVGNKCIRGNRRGQKAGRRRRKERT